MTEGAFLHPPAFDTHSISSHHIVLMIKTIFEKDYETLEKLAAKGQRRDGKGFFPIHVACLASDCRAIEILLKNGADVLSEDQLGRQPLHILAEKRSPTECVRLILERLSKRESWPRLAVSMQDKRGLTPVHLSIHTPSVLELLLEHATDLNIVQPSTGFTALMLASYHGNTESVRLLLQKGADISVVDVNRTKNALMLSVEEGNADIAQLLAEKDASALNVQDSSGMTALHYAYAYEHEGIAEMLLRAGADGTIVDSSGMVPVSYKESAEQKMQAAGLNEEEEEPVELEQVTLDLTQECSAEDLAENLTRYYATILPILAPALSELLKRHVSGASTEDPVRFLAEYLLEHNPNAPPPVTCPSSSAAPEKTAQSAPCQPLRD